MHVPVAPQVIVGLLLTATWISAFNPSPIDTIRQPETQLSRRTSPVNRDSPIVRISHSNTGSATAAIPCIFRHIPVRYTIPNLPPLCDRYKQPLTLAIVDSYACVAHYAAAAANHWVDCHAVRSHLATISNAATLANVRYSVRNPELNRQQLLTRLRLMIYGADDISISAGPLGERFIQSLWRLYNIHMAVEGMRKVPDSRVPNPPNMANFHPSCFAIWEDGACP